MSQVLEPASSILGVGDEAPDFELPDSTGGRVRLSQLLAERRGAVVFFFPKAFTPACTIEVCDFSAHRGELDDAGLAVVGIARDEPSRLAEFGREQGVDYLLLSDVDRAVHEAYGVLAVREADGERVEKVRRSTFVIGPDRRVRQAWHDVLVDGHALDVLGAAAPGR
jgi:peroxiredoxin Q/BCP